MEGVVERLEGGLVSDEELRKIIRSQLETRLRWGYKSTHEEQLAFHLHFIKSLKQADITTVSDSPDHVYEVPISFLKMTFGKTLKESASYFRDESMTLDEAEIATHDLYCERAQIKDGQRVLDIGCGQGSFMFHVAQKYKNCHVAGITNSTTQKNMIEEQCKNLNLSNMEVILADVTKFNVDSTFDRIVLIESLEHMKNYEMVLKKISKWMKQDGLLFVDCLCHKVFGHHFEKLEEDDLYSAYIFPNGITIQAVSTLLYFQDDVSIVDHWIVNGKHVARTMEEWLKKQDSNVDGVRDILESAFNTREAATKFITSWRTFFIAWIEQFSYNNGEEWMISQVLFKKK